MRGTRKIGSLSRKESASSDSLERNKQSIRVREKRGKGSKGGLKIYCGRKLRNRGGGKKGLSPGGHTKEKNEKSSGEKAFFKGDGDLPSKKEGLGLR